MSALAESNIYVVGGTVQAGRGVYIPRPADGELLDLCRRGQYVNVLTTRQVGKSSLMIRTVEHLRLDGIKTAVVDISGIGTRLDDTQWFLGLLKEITEQLGLQVNLLTWWEAKDSLGKTDRFVRFLEEVVLEEVSGRVVIFVDEIDTTRALTFGDDFFIAVRSLYNGRAHRPKLSRLSFVLVGLAATPQGLIQDKERTPYNIGTPLELTDFTFDEALPLAAGLGLPETQARQVLGWVLSWTEGHPYLTQQLCRNIARAGRSVWTEADVDELVAGTFSGRGSAMDSNLQFVLDMLTRRAPNLEEVLTTYRKVLRGTPPVPDEERSLVKTHLKLAGVVRRSEGMLRMRNRIYAETFDEAWVKNHLPVNWSRQVARGLMLVALILLLLNLPLSLFVYAKNRELRIARADLQKALEAQKDLNVNLTAAEAGLRGANQRLEFRNKELKQEQQKTQAALGAAEKATAEAQSSAKQAELAALSAERAALNEKAEREEAERNAARLYIYRGNERLLGGRALKGLAFLGEAAKHQEALGKDDDEIQLPLQLSLSTKANHLLTSQLVSLGHHAAVTHAAFSPDARHFITAAKDGTLKIGHREKNHPWNELKYVTHEGRDKGHDGPVNHTAFSHDNLRVVTVGNDSTAKVWDSETGQLVLQLGGEQARSRWPMLYADYDRADGRIVTASADGTAKVWDAKQGCLLLTLKGHGGYVSSAMFSPLGKYVVTASADGTAKVWDATTAEGCAGAKVWDASVEGSRQPVTLDIKGQASDGAGRGESNERFTPVVTLATFSPDGQYVVTASNDKKAMVWKSADGTLVAALEGHEAAVRYATFSEDGGYIVTASDDGSTKVWQLHADGGVRVKQTLGKSSQKDDNPVRYAELSRDNRYVVTASWEGGAADGSVKVWEVETGKLLTSIEGHRSKINVATVGIPDDGEPATILTASDDRTAKVWNWRVADETHTTFRLSKRANAAAISPDGALVVTASDNATVRCVETGELVSTYDGREILRRSSPLYRPAMIEDPQEVFFAAFSPNGEYIVTADRDHYARIYKRVPLDKPSGSASTPVSGTKTPPKGCEVAYQPHKTLRGHEDHVHFASFSTDSRRVVTASDDGTAKIWEVEGDAEPRTLPSDSRMEGSVNSAMFSRDGKFVVTADQYGKVIVWDANSGEEKKSAKVSDGDAYNAAFSPDGRSIVAAGDGAVTLWAWLDSKEPEPIPLEARAANSAVFSPDGKLIIAAGKDGVVDIFSAKTGERITSVGAPAPQAVQLTYAEFGPKMNPHKNRFVYRFVTSDNSGVVNIWDIGSEDLNIDVIRKLIDRLIPYKIEGGAAPAPYTPGDWVNPSPRKKPEGVDK